MVIKNETLPCQNSENPSSATVASKIEVEAAKANEKEEEEVVVKVEKEDQKDDEKSYVFEGEEQAEDIIITEEEDEQNETLSQDTLVHDVVSVSINSEPPTSADQQSNSTAEESSTKQLQNNNNSVSSPWVYYYPSSYDSYYITNTYDIEQSAEESPPGGAVAATSIMASAAIEHAGSVAGEPPQLIGAGEPIFTSSDLPLQPYATPTSHLPPHPPTAAAAPHAAPAPPYNDLFVNPAFAHMSFLSDGSMVGPNGEIYSPAEYFPSVMVEHSQDVPAVIPVSPQPGDYPPGHPAAGGHDAATPPPSTNIGKRAASI